MTQSDFWIAFNNVFASGDWMNSADWANGVPTTADTAVVLGGSILIDASEDAQAGGLDINGPLSNGITTATLEVDGILAAGSIALSDGIIDGSGEISASQLSEGAPHYELPLGAYFELEGAVELTASTMALYGDGPLTIGEDATLIGTGSSTIDQGALNGTGTLQNGTPTNVNANMAFVYSGLVSAGDDTNTIGTLVNYGNLTLEGVVQPGGILPAADPYSGSTTYELSAASIVNNGVMDFLPGAPVVDPQEPTGITGNGEIMIASGATAFLDANIGAGQTIVFASGGNAVLTLDETASDLTASFQGELSGIGSGDTIDLPLVASSQIAGISLNAAGTAFTVQTTGGVLTFALAQAWNPDLIVTVVGNQFVVGSTPVDAWTGASGDGQWSTPGNWSNAFFGSVPTLGETAGIGAATVTVGPAVQAQVGALQLSAGADLVIQGSMFLENSATIPAGAAITVNGGYLRFASSTEGLTVAPGAVFQGYIGAGGSGGFLDSLVDNGTVEATSGDTLRLQGALSGDGTLQIDGGAEMALGSIASAPTVDFAATPATPGTLAVNYVAGNATGPTLDNLGYGDSIVIGFNGGPSPSATEAGSTLTISDGNSGDSASFTLQNAASDLEFITSESVSGVVTATATDNIPPVITVPGSILTLGAAAQDVSGISVEDGDPNYTTITLTLTLNGAGSLFLNETATGGGASVTGTTLSVTGTASEINTVLATLVYTPSAGALGVQTGSISVTASNNGPDNIDGTNAATPQTIGIVSVAADVGQWTAIATGDWDSGATWSGGVAPGSNDDALIAAAVTVTAGADDSANSLTIDGPQAELDDTGSLSLADGASSIGLYAGTLDLGFGGAIFGHGAQFVLAGGTLDGSGTLDDLAFDGNLAVTGHITVQDGFSIASLNASLAQIDVGGLNFLPAGTLYFKGGPYYLQNISISLYDNVAGYGLATLESDNLTLGSGVTLAANRGAISGADLTNYGTMVATGTFDAELTDLDNAGSIIVPQTGDFDLENDAFDTSINQSLTNSGEIIVNGGTVFLTAGGYESSGNLGIDNTGSILLNGGSLLVASGFGNTTNLSIDNTGSIIIDDGNFTLQDGTLDNSTSITVENDGSLFVANTATLEGTGNIYGKSGAITEIASPVPTGAGYYFTDPSTLILDDAPQFNGTIGGFGPGDMLEVANETIDAASITGTLLTLDLANGTTLTFNVAPGESGDTFVPEPSGGVTVLCFVKGTLIATPAGEVPIELLSIGDAVVTQSGRVRRITWIGTGRVLATRGRRTAATPVIVRKGALADNVPHHDLRVTKAHSLFIDGALIPVEFLVNHRTILWDDRAQEVAIYHIELESHDVLLANGAPAESYRDDGNRWLFLNANSGWHLPPQSPCAPVLTGGPLVDAVWRRLLDRAGPRPRLPLSNDPDLHLSVDGRRVEAAARHGMAYIFGIADPQASVRIVSRSAVPAELGLARDPRCLGVALRRIVVRQGGRFRVTEAMDVRLAQGFHAYEVDSRYRWTNGDATIPPELLDGFNGAMELVLHVGDIARYLDEGALVRAA